MSRASLSSALDRVMEAKRDLAEAEAAHADALDRLREEAPDGETLVYSYSHFNGVLSFGHFLLTKDEDGGIQYRPLRELPDDIPAAGIADPAVAP